jgi:hypothetical protein
VRRNCQEIFSVKKELNAAALDVNFGPDGFSIFPIQGDDVTIQSHKNQIVNFHDGLLPMMPSAKLL